MREILVIGSVLLDIVATFDRSMEKKIDKIGALRYSIGGVGYNIAANLAARGIPTSFLTCLKGNSLSSSVIRPFLEYNRFRSLYIVEADHIVEPAYVALSREGQLVSGITSCEMDKITFEEEFLQKAIEKASLVAAETNLSVDQIRQIAAYCKKFARPLVVSIVSDAKADRVYQKKFPCKFDLVALNADEAAHLGVLVCRESSPKEIASVCHALNSKTIFITQGKKGYKILDESGEFKDVASLSPANFRNDIGAGDALFAAACAGRLEDDGRLDGHEVRARVTEWVTSVLTREESNLGPRKVERRLEKRGTGIRALLVLILGITAVSSMIVGVFWAGITRVLFGICLFLCAITSGSVGALLSELRSCKPRAAGATSTWIALALGMVAGLVSSLAFVLPHLSVGDTARTLRFEVDDLNLLVILSFVVSLSAGFGLETFYAGLGRGAPVEYEMPNLTESIE